MPGKKNKRILTIAAVLVLLLFVGGCGGEDVKIAPDEGRGDMAEVPAVEQDERDVVDGDEVIAPDTSGLWAPPVTPPADYAYHFNMHDLVESLPSAEDVPFPAYPGAYAVGHSEGQNGILPRMTLLSSDPPETVIAFYQEQLEGWEYENTYFWPSDAGDYMDAGGFLIPSIQVLEASNAMRAMMPDAKSDITVAY